MPSTVNAFGAHKAGQPLTPVTIERRDVGPHDVRLDILYCGICHSDINFVDGSFGPLPAGRTGAVLPQGPHPRLRQPRPRRARRPHPGRLLRGDRRPRGLRGPRARSPRPGRRRPLLCAGITVYAPLKRFGARPGTKVAVVGLGGLGHLGVKMAKAMGADVTVLSQSDRKREAATALGADHYAVTGDGSAFTDLANTFDIILNTVSAPISVPDHLGMLRLHGTMVNVGVTTEPMPMDVFTLCQNGRSYVGSLFGGIAETREMLDFAAEHQVTADIELIGAKDINTAYERIHASDVRYRFEVDGSTFADLEA